MNLLSRRSALSIAAVTDIAIHARPDPVSAKDLSQRLNLPPRHLEGILQALVHSGILKGTRGPKGGYSLMKERRKIIVSDIVRAVMENGDEKEDQSAHETTLMKTKINPMIEKASQAFLRSLDNWTIEDLCAEKISPSVISSDFSI